MAPATHRPSNPVKRLAFGLPYWAFMPLVLANEMARIARTRRAGRRLRVPTHVADVLTRRPRRSERVFILGNGASVNSYGAAEWDAIRGADSIGMSFWVLHDFVPSYLAVEWPRDADRASVMKEALEARVTDFAGVPIIAKALDARGLSVYPTAVRNNVFVIPPLGIPGRTFGEVSRSVEALYRLGAFTGPGTRLSVPMQRASLSYVISLATVMGYREIVLCGVDLSNTRYFYEENAAEYAARGRAVPRTGQPATVHLTMDDTAAVPIDQIVMSINQHVLKQSGVHLYVALRSSALHPRLPAFFEP